MNGKVDTGGVKLILNMEVNLKLIEKLVLIVSVPWYASAQGPVT